MSRRRKKYTLLPSTHVADRDQESRAHLAPFHHSNKIAALQPALSNARRHTLTLRHKNLHGAEPMCYGHHSAPLHQLPQGHLAAINISVGITTETHGAIIIIINIIINNNNNKIIIIIIIIVIKPEPLLHSPHPKHSLPHPKLEQKNKAAAVAATAAATMSR
jgi:hypothetical protein